ncbi:DsbA family protein [Candidatus Saccharibacteria bacterium]|nr:DsbA family protein [Candidatus Saccharibacteria bacterium]
MSRKVIIGLAISILVIIGGVVLWNMTEESPRARANDFDYTAIITEGDDAEKNQAPANFADRVFGNAESPIVVVEYGDFACSACAMLSPIIDEIRSEFGEQVAFVFRHMPLSTMQGHENSRAAALAAEVAGKQGKFWDYKAMLFRNQASWTFVPASERLSVFREFAESLGLDAEQFEEDFRHYSRPINQRLDFHVALARRQDVAGTPTVFLNGEEIDNAALFDRARFRSVLERALEQ